MCLASLSTALFTLPTDYAYDALVRQPGALPAGRQLLWFASWAAIPVFGLILPLILSRFPNGQRRPHWRFADWVAIAGTLAFGSSVALGTTPMPLAPPSVEALMAPYANNPFGVAIPGAVDVYLWMSGLGVIVLAYMLSAGALLSRFHSATHEDGIKLKWFAYAGTLIALSAAYSGIAWYRTGDLLSALIPFELALWTLPVAIGIAILRYRLFDIDLIINRTLVYGTLTAVLAAAYSASITLFQRLYVASTGQRSDAVYVLSAFGLVVVFSPLKDWLQHRVDKRIGHRSPLAVLEEFRSGIDAVVSVLDMQQIACRFLDRAVMAFDARGAALYLRSQEPVYGCGHLNGGPLLEVPLEHNGQQLGRLVLAERRGHIVYAPRDRDALRRSADTVGEALALAARFDHRPLATSPIKKEATSPR